MVKLHVICTYIVMPVYPIANPPKKPIKSILPILYPTIKKHYKSVGFVYTFFVVTDN